MRCILLCLCTGCALKNQPVCISCIVYGWTRASLRGSGQGDRNKMAGMADHQGHPDDCSVGKGRSESELRWGRNPRTSEVADHQITRTAARKLDAEDGRGGQLLRDQIMVRAGGPPPEEIRTEHRKNNLRCLLAITIRSRQASRPIDIPDQRSVQEIRIDVHHRHHRTIDGTKDGCPGGPTRDIIDPPIERFGKNAYIAFLWNQIDLMVEVGPCPKSHRSATFPTQTFPHHCPVNTTRLSGRRLPFNIAANDTRKKQQQQQY